MSKKGKDRKMNTLLPETTQAAVADVEVPVEVAAIEVAVEAVTDNVQTPEVPVSVETVEAIAVSETVADVIAAFQADPPVVDEEPAPIDKAAASTVIEVEVPVEEVAPATDAPADPPVPDVEVPADVTDAAKEIASLSPEMRAALQLIIDLKSRLAAAVATKGTRRVASGSKPRPNVHYTLLGKPPAWSGTPQVGQLIQIIYAPEFIKEHTQADGTIKVDEPTLFAQIERGAAAGVLRTKQAPVRIFQYYRSDLRAADAIAWS